VISVFFNSLNVNSSIPHVHHMHICTLNTCARVCCFQSLSHSWHTVRRHSLHHSRVFVEAKPTTRAPAQRPPGSAPRSRGKRAVEQWRQQRRWSISGCGRSTARRPRRVGMGIVWAESSVLFRGRCAATFLSGACPERRRRCQPP